MNSELRIIGVFTVPGKLAPQSVCAAFVGPPRAYPLLAALRSPLSFMEISFAHWPVSTK